MKKAVKFGGSSLSSASQFQKVAQIIRADDSRRFVIPSAPGKRDSWDTKVTDLLYTYYDMVSAGNDTAEIQEKIRFRYEEIVRGLNLKFPLDQALEEIRHHFERGCGRDYAASRGEYLNGRIMAEYLGFPFVDAAEVIRFDAAGVFLPDETNAVLRSRLSGLSRAVIPGFYGSMPDGTIKTFSRGGSDITGSLVARAIDADLYENWTDVSGFLLADPRIVDSPVAIGTITYQELHELACMGACVLHEDAIYPVREAGIPINIKNTNQPQDVGTMIVSSAGQQPNHEITGIAGKKGYCTLSVRKTDLDVQTFERRVMEILEARKIPCESVPTGPDSISILVPQKSYYDNEFAVLSRIQSTVHPDALYLDTDLALVAIGGRGNRAKDHIVNSVFSALTESHIHIRTVDQGMKDLAMVIGVSDQDFEATIRVIYNKFIHQEGLPSSL